MRRNALMRAPLFLPSIPLLTALLLFVLGMPAGVGAQTLLGSDIESGGYGGPAVRATTINGDVGVMFGGQGAWVVSRKFGIGGAGYGLTTEHEVQTGGEEYELSLGFGGLMLEYFNGADRLTHLHGGLIIGVGGMTLSQQGSVSDLSDTVLVIESTLHIGLRVTESFRVSVLAGYRFVTGTNDIFETDYGLTGADLSGFVLGADFRFGRY